VAFFLGKIPLKLIGKGVGRFRPASSRNCVVGLIDSGLFGGEFSRRQNMALRGTDPESYITEYTNMVVTITGFGV